MKILSITAQKPHSTGSGVYLTELVKSFAQMGHTQAVIAGVYPDDTIAFPPEVAFFPVYFRSQALPFPIAGMSDEMPYESTIYRQMTDEMLEGFAKAFLETAQQAVESFQPDIILCHHLYFLTALIRHKFPNRYVVAICHGTGLRQLQKHSLRQDFILEHLQSLDHVFALHTSQKEVIQKICGIDSQKISVIGTGYNSAVFRELDLPRKPAVIFAGKLAEKKGVMSLLRAIRQIQAPFPLKLAGGAGNEQELIEIHQLADACHHPVEFLGRLDQPHLAEAFNRCTLFVLPSFYEGLPLVILEAMACGLNVVCTDIPGVKTWLDNSIPGHNVHFVSLPEMRNADEPNPESLPAFEAALAKEIEACLALGSPPSFDLQHLSWNGVCSRILQFIS